MGNTSGLKRQLILSIFILTLTFSLTIFTTFAWFLVSSSNNVNNIVMEVANNGLVKGITIHSFKELSSTTRIYNKDAVVTYNVDKSSGAITTTDDVASLGKYDSLASTTIFSCLYVITLDTGILKSRSSSISIVPSTTTDEENSLLKTKIKASDNPMSSIITFSYPTSITKDTSENYLVDFSSLASEQFLTITSSSKTTYTQTLNGISIDPGKITSNEEDYYVYMTVSYLINNIEYIYSSNLGSEVLDNVGTDASITYKQDWKIKIL